MKDTVIDVAVWFLVLPLRVYEDLQDRERRRIEQRRSQRA